MLKPSSSSSPSLSLDTGVWCGGRLPKVLHPFNFRSLTCALIRLNGQRSFQSGQ
uniref:Uncharacterized protein n=1 Tax=Physcomitrium patens TaxID=3218 RepID=A0A2K1IEK0_PHYPA|nr:hypothetical protein PHYPA_029854 [Physcomitrium patens]